MLLFVTGAQDDVRYSEQAQHLPPRAPRPVSPEFPLHPADISQSPFHSPLGLQNQFVADILENLAPLLNFWNYNCIIFLTENPCLQMALLFCVFS